MILAKSMRTGLHLVEHVGVWKDLQSRNYADADGIHRIYFDMVIVGIGNMELSLPQDYVKEDE